MGAWIEILTLFSVLKLIFVAPLVGAWIEITNSLKITKQLNVAPLVGAWIEIALSGGLREGYRSVAPLVGAWIEIARNWKEHSQSWSLLSWERGLKSMLNLYSVAFNDVAPLVGAWIEITSCTS